jgi:Fe-S cluster biogenesis protein NfuA
MLQQQETQALPSATADDARRQLIEAAIEEIRPGLRRDGGDCVLVGIEGKTVMVKLTGACMFCKLSGATLEGIQSRIVEKLGEFVRLVPVPGAAKPAH